MTDDDIAIKPIDEPYAFIYPDYITQTEYDPSNEVFIEISNAGSGFLIIFDISSDADWIRIEGIDEKKVMESSDEPAIIKIILEKEKLPAGEHKATITIQTIQNVKESYNIPITALIPKEDAALIVPSAKVIDFGSVPINKEYGFLFANDSADQVYLHGDFTNWELGVIPMLKVEGQHIAYIPLEDGEYLYQFKADDRLFPDPDNQQRIVIGEHGNCSSLKLNRYSRILSLKNVGTKSMKVKLNHSEGINLSEQEFWIEKAESKDIEIFLLPHLMKLGINSYNVGIEQKSRQIGNILIQAKGISYGPVTEISPSELSLGEVFRGSEIAGRLKIRNVGKDTLKINIISEVSWLKSDKIEIAEGVESDIPILVDSTQLSPDEYRTNITLLTNDYIYNRDRYIIPLDFKLVSMDIDPKEIDFGAMWVGEPKEISLRARRSDGAKIELEIPQDLPSWLDASTSGRQTINFKINWDKLFLESDRNIEANIKITDKRSQLIENLHIKAKILIPHIAVDEVNFGAGKWKTKKLPMVIKNMGNGKLVIHKIEISEEQKWISVAFKKNRKAQPSFSIMVDRRRIPKQDRANQITSVVKIYSNDPIEPTLNLFIPIEP